MKGWILFSALFSSLFVYDDLLVAQEKSSECDIVKTGNRNVLSIKTNAFQDTWIGTGDGLSYVTRDGHHESFSGPKSGWYVSDIALDAGGMPWAATSDGLYFYQPQGKS